jgi:hypothetical protein
MITFANKLSGTPSTGLYLPEKTGVVRRFLKFAEVHATYNVQLYWSNVRESLLAFSQEYAKSEMHSDLRSMAQRFLGNFTRPLEHFAEGSQWWVRCMRVFGFDSSQMELLARSRRKAQQDFRQRLAQDKVYHVACRRTVEDWARTGNRRDIIAVKPYAESKDERIERLSHLENLLEGEPNLNLYLCEQKMADDVFTGLAPGHEVSWVVQGHRTIILNIIDRSNAKPESFYASISDAAAARKMQEEFSHLWKVIETRYDRVGVLDEIRKWKEEAKDAKQ